MGCFHPLHGFKTAKGQWTSQWPNNLNTAEPMTVPCRQCTGCRAEYSRQWAMRIKHEASLYLQNSFITLTYNDAHLPKDNSLVKKDFQLFIKRLRKKHVKKNNYHPQLAPKSRAYWAKKHNIRFFHCGEYGDPTKSIKTGRPHYHAIIFNHHFTQKDLQELWSIKEKPIGFVDTGTVTFESASYVAGYIHKKINGNRKLDHYNTYDRLTGEQITHRQQEYATMSRRPGIAKHWFDKHKTDAYPSDFITMNGKKMKPAKYYDRQYELLYPEEMAQIKEKRQKEMEQLQHLFTPEALKQKELNHKGRMALYSRRNKL
jgi:hypothetical protein